VPEKIERGRGRGVMQGCDASKSLLILANRGLILAYRQGGIECLREEEMMAIHYRKEWRSAFHAET
jgi:hypothetical protein